ncbi:lysoplasmalogenase family protein [Sphingomonas sp. UYAg733]
MTERIRSLIFIAALVAGATLLPVSTVITDPVTKIIWKGAGVALLALWAALAARNMDGWLIAVVLALGALGDVLIEISGLVTGALAFLAGHIVAIFLYLRHRREVAPGWIVAVLLIVLTPLIAWVLPSDRSAAPGIALYATGLGAMAACAWLSRFPRHIVALGAMLFVISDLLIFSRIGPLAGSAVPALLVWPTYFAGQALIAWGVVTALRRTAG